jgi:hypothetical protein
VKGTQVTNSAEEIIFLSQTKLKYALRMKIAVSCDVMPCGLVIVPDFFGGKKKQPPSIGQKMEMVDSTLHCAP